MEQERAPNSHGKIPGQGSTEYLILLAVVLIVALVSIALLGFFPGISTDAKLSQSESYWKSASPIAIVGGSASPHGVEIGGGSAMAQDSIIVRLKNNGGSPVQIIGLKNTQYMESEQGAQGTCGIYHKSGQARLQYFDPCRFESDGYNGYIGPPRGDGARYWGGTGEQVYKQENILLPGEEISLGYSLMAVTVDGYRPENYGVSPCSKKTYATFDEIYGETADPPMTSKIMEIRDFEIYYYDIQDGSMILKRFVGTAPLMLRCTDENLLGTP